MKYLLAAETAPTEELTLWEEVVASLKTFFLDNWLNVVYFFVALLVGIVLVKIILRITRAVLARSKMEKITQSFLLSLLKFVLYLLLILILAQIIGIPITGLVALISAAGLAVSAGAAGFPLKPLRTASSSFRPSPFTRGLRADQRRGGDGQKYPHAHHRAGDAGQ